MPEAQENRINFMEFMGALRSGKKRLDVVNKQGEVIFQCGPGPFGFDIDGWVQAIERVI